MSAIGLRRGALVATCLVATLAAGAGTWAVVGASSGAPAAASDAGHRAHHATATIVQGDLTDSKVFAGTLGYGTPTGVDAAAAGTLTWLPKPGDVVHRDEQLYAVDERAVRTMHGTVPFWRTLERGLKGTDVRQLNANLAALGYDVSQDEVFGQRTQRAVQRWQKDRGHVVTGRLTADDIAFTDGDVRVASVSGRVGQQAGGDVMQVTSPARVVTATVAQRDAERLAVGTAVRVRVNGAGEPLAGSVSDVEPSAAEDAGDKVDVTVRFDAGDRELPAAASAQLEAAGTTEHDVLSVPVAAIVATGDGKYAVDVVRKGGTTKRTAVEAGFTADGRVAISGAVHAGDRVVVPG